MTFILFSHQPSPVFNHLFWFTEFTLYIIYIYNYTIIYYIIYIILYSPYIFQLDYPAGITSLWSSGTQLHPATPIFFRVATSEHNTSFSPPHGLSPSCVEPPSYVILSLLRKSRKQCICSQNFYLTSILLRFSFMIKNTYFWSL